MGGLLSRLGFLKPADEDSFADGHGRVTHEDRGWEDGYRQRWQFDRVVRSTHGVNCTGSCGWNVYVKGGIVTWETQVLDYPRTRPDLPDHEPRGCARGASASWYLYSANRIKHPLVRRHLIELWRDARRTLEPVEAWASIVEDADRVAAYKTRRGRGGFVRLGWDEANELIAAANLYTIRTFGPDRVVGFSPIPAMSMVSYAAGTRYLSLIGGTVLSFYDWYADLPPASPQTWGEQTDVPESADWYNSAFLMVWGSNVPQTRTPDAHFLAEVRYKGTKTVVVTPDFSEASKFADLWLDPVQGTDSAVALAMGHVILKEFHVERRTPYFLEYCRELTDLPFLVTLDPLPDGPASADGSSEEAWQPGRFLRASDLDGALGEREHAEWKTLAYDVRSGGIVAPNGSIGFRWGEPGRWNLESRASTAGDGQGPDGAEVELQLSLREDAEATARVAFPYFGGAGGGGHAYFATTEHPSVLYRDVPVRLLRLEDRVVRVATVYDLMLAHYGVVPGVEDDDPAAPYTPAWQERITGLSAEKVTAVAREMAETAARTRGRAMVIIGTGVNQWYHGDMTYRAVINALLLCGCVGVPGGGWSHYVGQEKLRPQAGWQAIAFAQDWVRPPRQMNGTSFWYQHSDQWRYETVEQRELLSPLVERETWDHCPIDFNTRAIRMGWLPTSPQLDRNPLAAGREARERGEDPGAYVVRELKEGSLRFAAQDPDAPENWPRNLFVWRSNLLGSSSKGHEYFLKHLVGASNGVQAEDLGRTGGTLPKEVRFREQAPEGKLDLLCTIDFRMSSTCMYSDLVLPTATWYEKNDLSTTDMHPFIHPLTGAVDPVWGCRSDWEIFKGIARSFSALAPGVLGTETDLVLQPLMHDSPSELGQPLEVADWARGECEPVPGKTLPHVVAVERNYPETYARFTALGPLLETLGNGTKGIQWDARPELDQLRAQNGTVRVGSADLPAIERDVDVCEAILSLSPETCGAVAVRAWEQLEPRVRRPLAHLASGRAAEAIRFHDLVAQPRKVITSPTWSGVDADDITYTGSYLNVHERIPWRTLTGRQHVYQDHAWMRGFGEGFALYRPPIDTRSVEPVRAARGGGAGPEKVLNFLTPHQKWGIHSSFTDTQMMLTLSRGGPCVWISEADAKELQIEDNDWIEAYNRNGALAARAVVSQRIKPGIAMMYHSQDKTVNAPGAPATGTRGIHNSISRIAMKPTHMIGGYAQLSYGFNYYGTVGANRDDFVVVRKLASVDWLDGENGEAR